MLRKVEERGIDKKGFKTMCSKNHLTEMANNSYVNSKDSWILDTGASSHFSCNKNLFTTFEKVTNTKMSVAVDGFSFPVEGKGKIELQFSNRKIVLDTIIHSPKLR